MNGRGPADQGVVHGSTRQIQSGKLLRQLTRRLLGEKSRLGKVVTEYRSHLGGSAPGRRWEPGEDGIGLEPGMSSQTEKLPIESVDRLRVRIMIPHDQGNRHAGVDEKVG